MITKFSLYSDEEFLIRAKSGLPRDEALIEELISRFDRLLQADRDWARRCVDLVKEALTQL